MKMIEIVNAKGALQKLVTQDLPIRAAFDLMKLTDECNQLLTFYWKELCKFDPKTDPDRLEELDGLEVENLDGKRIRIRFDDALKLSAADIKNLQPFVEFIEEE